MATATVNGVDLYYTEVGSGVPCIALHGGLGMDHTYFARTFGPLEDVLHFIYVDQRGNGLSERPALETITIPQLAEDVEALRSHLGLDRIALLGHSYGGFVALEYATRFADRLSHLVLLDTSPGVFEPTADELAERPDPSTVSPDAVAATQALFASLPATDEEYAAKIQSLARAYIHRADPAELSAAIAGTIMDAKTLVRGFEVFAGWSVADKLHAITTPTLVLCGRYDLQTTPECSARLSTAIPGAELIWFENSGHFPWIEEADAFFSAVKGFFERHP